MGRVGATAKESVIAEISYSISSRTGRTIVFEHVRCQQQVGIDDCGLFALANATALCNGQDPAAITYDQGAMRQHLLNALERGELTPFPQMACSKKRKAAKNSWTERMNIYCNCRLPDDKTTTGLASATSFSHSNAILVLNNLGVGS